MLRNKLMCLEHPNPDGINVDDEKQFRNLLLWLEEQKIRHYKIEDRAELRKINKESWLQTFDKYKNDLSCPTELITKLDQLKWIVGYAVKLEYLDNVDTYRGMTSQKMKEVEQGRTSAPSVKSVNPFDNLDFASPEFEAGVRLLAEKLNIPHHHDHLQVLAGVSRIIKDNLNKEALKQPLLEGKPYPIFEGQGMYQSDEDIEQAARILRLLQIQSIREIQTIINETIVEAQSFTTDTPKTDTRLGQVGR